MTASLHTSIEMELIPDESPDTSYLEQEGFEDRLAAYQRGDFGFVGVRAVAEIKVAGVLQRITSPGLWGIEDDSGDEYFAAVFEDEKAQLREMLDEMGIDKPEPRDETYEGWSNYPTWAVNLWLSNDEPLYRETLDRARAIASSNSDRVAGELADNLRSWVVDDLAPDLGATFAADLLGYALGEVDWYEIAQAWLEDVSAEVDS